MPFQYSSGKYLFHAVKQEGVLYLSEIGINSPWPQIHSKLFTCGCCLYTKYPQVLDFCYAFSPCYIPGNKKPN